MTTLADHRRAASESVRRTLTAAADIEVFQKIMEGDTVEIEDEADRAAMRETILAQRDAIIEKAKGNPKAEGNCVLEYTTADGQKIQFASSKSERETIRMLDEAYLRLGGSTDVQKRNAAIVFSLTTLGDEKTIPFEFLEMLKSVRAEATAVFGKKGVRQNDEDIHSLVNVNVLTQDARKLTAEGKALTPDNIRAAYRANCFAQSALHLVQETVRELLRQMGRKTLECARMCAHIRTGLQTIIPETFEALANAKTADEAKTILDGVMDTIRETTVREAAANDVRAKLEGFMNEALAREFGVLWNPANGKLAPYDKLAAWQGNALVTDIATGKVKANTAEEITEEFKKLARETAHAHAELLRSADGLGLSGDAVDRIKQHLLKINSFKHLDLAKIKTIAENIDVKPLVDAFAAKAPMDTIYEEISKLFQSAESKLPVIFEGAEELGPDETVKAVPLLIFMALDKSPNLAAKLEEFFADGDVQNAIEEDEGELPYGVPAMNMFMARSTPTPAQLSATLDKPDMHPLFAQALIRAADDAGLAQLPPEKKLAAFAPGTEAGRVLREALASMPSDMATTPEILYGLARGAARRIDAKGFAARVMAFDKVADGTSPAARTIQNFILDASGAPKNAPVREKLDLFNAKLQEETRKELVSTFTRLVTKHLVKTGEGGNRVEDFDGEHGMFKRDVVDGAMRVHLPGGGKLVADYKTARDQLVQFITGDDKATYKAASANVKKQTGLLMSIVTQYGPSMVRNAFISTLSKAGHTITLAGGFMKAQNPFVKPQTWTLAKAEDGSINVSVRITTGCGFLLSEQGQTIMDDTASYEETALDITIPADNLASLADQDWSTFDEGPFSAAGNDSDAQLAAIPKQFLLDPTVTATNHLHFDAPSA